MLEIERKITATAALNQPGGEWAALWQRRRALATMRHFTLYPDAKTPWQVAPYATIPLWAVLVFRPPSDGRQMGEHFVVRGVKTIAVAAALSGLAIAAGPAKAAAAYDGEWTVLFTTEKGKCDHSYRYDVSVSQGKIHYTSYTSVTLNGTVSPLGGVMVSIRHFDDVANGSGHLAAHAGSGGWRGTGKDGACSGLWKAQRR